MARLKAWRERGTRKRRAPVRSPAERARNTSSAAANRSRSRAAADDVADTSGSSSGSSHAPSTATGAPEPGGTAGSGPPAGGASNLAAVRFYRPSGSAGRHVGPILSLTECAGPLQCAWTKTEGHAASGALCLTCTLARRWPGVAQPRSNACARGVVRQSSERPAPM
jgi:hypothetical protein